MRLIRVNRERHAPRTWRSSSETAPGACLDLPNPGRGLRGRKRRKSSAIVDLVTQRRHGDTTLVVNLRSLLSDWAEALAVLRAREWSVEVTEVVIARSSAVSTLTRLSAQNPVFVISASRRGD